MAKANASSGNNNNNNNNSSSSHQNQTQHQSQAHVSPKRPLRLDFTVNLYVHNVVVIHRYPYCVLACRTCYRERHVDFIGQKLAIDAIIDPIIFVEIIVHTKGRDDREKKCLIIRINRPPEEAVGPVAHFDWTK
jgi:hypothetical protein